MVWARFDDMFPFHRKIRPLKDAAFRLHVSAVCWCASNLTDGVIDGDDLETVSDVRRPGPAAAELVHRGNWHTHGHDCPACPQPPEKGWVIHDFLVYNHSREQVETVREKRREAGAQGGKASGKTRANAKQSASDLVSKTEAQVASSVTNPRTRTNTPTTTAGGEPHDWNARSDEPPRCSNHQSWAREDIPDCWACGHKREQWEATRTADDVFQRPTWCCDCDQWTRLVETDTGMARCPACHPLAHGEPA